MGNCRIEEKFRSCHRNFEWAPVRMPRVYSLYPSSTWTLISPDSSPGVLMANPLESGNSFVSPGVEAIALASRTYGLDGALTEDMSLESSEGSRSSMCCTHQPKIHCSLLRCLVSLFGRSLHYDDKERSSGLWVFIDVQAFEWQSTRSLLLRYSVHGEARPTGGENWPEALVGNRETSRPS